VYECISFCLFVVCIKSLRMVYSRHERGHGVDKKVNLTARTYTKKGNFKSLENSSSQNWM